MLVQVGGLVFEVTGFGDVEIDPHQAVIGQGRQGLALLDKAALLVGQAVYHAVKRRFDRDHFVFVFGVPLFLVQ